MKWSEDVPEKEGWYFWKARRRTKDPWHFHAYFIRADTDEWSVWENGTLMSVPRGGFWSEKIG